eukprot:c45728_g1_i1 orf=2-301(-)
MYKLCSSNVFQPNNTLRMLAEGFSQIFPTTIASLPTQFIGPEAPPQGPESFEIPRRFFQPSKEQHYFTCSTKSSNSLHCYTNTRSFRYFLLRQRAPFPFV